jgi:hypothetical protein
MKYRRLDSTWDMCFGRGNADYLVDSVENPEAVAQAIKTRMLLFTGEWWMNIRDGLPLWQKILGQRVTNKSIIDRILVDRIRGLKLPNNIKAITNISNTSSTLDGDTRAYSFSCVVDTVYGKVVVTNADQGGE